MTKSPCMKQMTMEVSYRTGIICSVVLKENPLLLHVYGWIMNPKRNWFCFESLFLILMYWCSFSQGHETCLRKFVSILCTANALSEKKNT